MFNNSEINWDFVNSVLNVAGIIAGAVLAVATLVEFS